MVNRTNSLVYFTIMILLSLLAILYGEFGMAIWLIVMGIGALGLWNTLKK